MSTPIAEITQQAYRETNLIPIGVEPTAAEQTEGLRRLQAIIKSVMGNEVGEELQAWDIPERFPNYRASTNLEPWPNSRLLCQLAAPTTVTFPARGLRDGARMAVHDLDGDFATNNLTIDANGYLIDGALTDVLSTNNQIIEYMFRADLGEWIIWTDLEIDDNMPFPQEFDELFVALLAMRLNPRHNSVTRGETQATIQRGILQLRARYRQKVAMPSELALQQRTRELFAVDFGAGETG